MVLSFSSSSFSSSSSSSSSTIIKQVFLLVTAGKGIIFLQAELCLKIPHRILFVGMSSNLHPSLYLCLWQCDFWVPPISVFLPLEFGLVLWLALVNRIQKYYYPSSSGLESFCLLSWKLGFYHENKSRLACWMMTAMWSRSTHPTNRRHSLLDQLSTPCQMTTHSWGQPIRLRLTQVSRISKQWLTKQWLPF